METNDTPSKNVLVVEDEMLLRIRAVDIVEGAGFIAIEAANADQALAILESRSDISLLFTDIQMPGSIDGLKPAHTVHRRWPEIKIVLVSGQVRPSDTDKPVDSLFFGKPLEVKQMIAEHLEVEKHSNSGRPPPHDVVNNRIGLNCHLKPPLAGNILRL